MDSRSERRSVLFVDVSDSTALYARLGDAAGRGIMHNVLALLRSVVERHDGKIVEEIGDELMCLFGDPDRAADTAMAMQIAMSTATFAGADRPMRVRIGFHEGEVVLDGEQIYGASVLLARRVVNSAKPSQILTTRQTAEAMSAGAPKPTRPVDRIDVGGNSVPVELVELVWNLKDVTLLGASLERPSTVRNSARLVVRYEGGAVELGSRNPVVTIGRENSDLVFSKPWVSRRHARIEYRRGRFVYVDQSTNGTHVSNEAGALVFVRNEEFPLGSEGTIRIGSGDEPSKMLRLTFSTVSGDAVGDA